MLLDGEPPGQRRPRRNTYRTSGQIEGLLAGEAPEVVVVSAPDGLVAGLLAGQLDEGDFAVLPQSLDGPVDRGYSEPRYLLPGTGVDLPYRQRPVRIPDALENGVSLPGVSCLPHAPEYTTRRKTTLNEERTARRGSFHGVVPTLAERVTAQDAPRAHGASPDRPVLLDRLDRVPGTVGREPARRRKERRYEPLISPDDPDEKPPDHNSPFYARTNPTTRRRG